MARTYEELGGDTAQQYVTSSIWRLYEELIAAGAVNDDMPLAKLIVFTLEDSFGIKAKIKKS